jgi:outer membrane biogenesis lipoprotein LolB
MKRTIALSALLMLVGCEREAESTAPATNNEYHVERLFTTDGCTAYRFHDAGIARYFVKCENGKVNTKWKEGCGKNCSRSVEVPTV